MNKIVCIITSTHISYNPRVVKEADALFEAGYVVYVVSVIHQNDKKLLDEALMLKRKWQLFTLDVRKKGVFSSKRKWLIASLRQKVFFVSTLLKRFPNGREYAYSRFFSELTSLASYVPADLYIAHNLPALPVASKLAKNKGALLGFDAEDYHRGEFVESSNNKLIISLTKYIEKKYIPQCHYVTAASNGIAQRYARDLNISIPKTILNSFPLSERSGKTPEDLLKEESKHGKISLYWYSQVIGSDRGLETVLTALPKLPSNIIFCIRGEWDEHYKKIFYKKVATLSISDRIHYLPAVPPEQLVERAAQHDIGLALESTNTVNRNICVTNKILVYHLSGLAIAATATMGHQNVIGESQRVGFLFKEKHVQGFIDGINYLLDGDNLAITKKNSYSISAKKYCWDVEKIKLVDYIDNIISHSLAYKKKQ